MGITKIPGIISNPQVEPQPQVEIKTDVPSDQLLRALYWVWDAFERTNMPFFLVFKTAENVIAQHDLTGDHVDVGVRRNEWISGAKSIFDAFIGEPSKIEDDKTTYLFENEIPVIVHVFEDDECIVNTDMIRYRSEEFKVPNPYSRFKEVYEQRG